MAAAEQTHHDRLAARKPLHFVNSGEDPISSQQLKVAVNTCKHYICAQSIGWVLITGSGRIGIDIVVRNPLNVV